MGKWIFLHGMLVLSGKMKANNQGKCDFTKSLQRNEEKL